MYNVRPVSYKTGQTSMLTNSYKIYRKIQYTKCIFYKISIDMLKLVSGETTAALSVG